MELQTTIPQGAKTIEYNTKLNAYASLLGPVIFEDDHCYCCILGQDFRFAIKGFGHSPEEAIEDWEVSLKKRIDKPFASDGLAAYVIGKVASLANAS